MLSSSITREVLPFLTFIFLQIFQIQTENDFDYSLESPTLLTTSEIAEEIMNQNLNLNCAGLKEFFNSETYQDVEKILNMTNNSTEVIENREQYHSRIKRCSEMERQDRILREFEKRNRRKEFIGNHKPDRGNFKQKHQKDNTIYETISHESPLNYDSEEDANKDDVLRGDLARSMHDSASTDSYLRTYRTLSGNPSQLTTNSASLETFTKDNQEKQQSSFKNTVKKEPKILKENRHHVKDSSTISYPIPHTKSSLQLKNEPETRSTTGSENEEKKKKGLLVSLLGNIRNVMEGGVMKNIDQSSEFDLAKKSSSAENVTDEESLIEYETVTPHQFINVNNLDKFRNEQKIKGTSSSSTTENPQIVRGIQDETKKQLQSKIEELIKIRKKLLEIVRIADSTKNQTTLSSVPFSRSSNKKKVKEARANSKNNLDSKRKSNVKNKIDGKNDSLGHQSSSGPSSSISTSFENSPHKTTKLSLLKTHDLFKNSPMEQNSPIYHTSELPSLETHLLKHHFPKHEGHLDQHVSDPDSSQNRAHLDSFFSPRSQDIEKKKKDGDMNSQKTSKIEEHFTKTNPSKSSSTFNLIHTHTKQTRSTEDPFISKSSTKSPLTGEKVTGISSSTISKIEEFPTQFDESVLKKTKTLDSGISEKKNSEIFLRERAQSEIGIDRTENKYHLKNASPHSVLGSTIKPEEIEKLKKIITQHSTTSGNSYTEPKNVRQNSLDTTQTSNRPHLSQISSISHLHHLEMSSKTPTNSQTLYLRENEPEEAFQTSSTLKLPHSKKMTSPQYGKTFSKELILKENSHSDTSITPHTSFKRQDLLSKPIFTSESPYPKKGATPNLFNHHETPPTETVALKNIHSSDIPTTQSTHRFTEENAATMEHSHSTLSASSQTPHLSEEVTFSKTHEAFPKSKLSSETPKSTLSPSEPLKLTLLPSDIPNLKKIEIFNSLHQHEAPSKKSSTLENAHSIDKFAPESSRHSEHKLTSSEHSHFEKIPTIHSPHTTEKDPNLVPVITKLSDLKKVKFFQHENPFKETPASFNHHSTKTATIQPHLEFETTSEDQIPTQGHHSNGSSIFGSLNKIEISSDLVGRSHQSISKEFQKSQHHTTTLNPIIVSLLKKLKNPQLVEKLEKLRKNFTPQKQNFGKITTLRPVHLHEKISSETSSPRKPHIDGNSPPSLHHHSQQPNLDKISHPGHQHLEPSHLEKTPTIRPPHLFEVSLRGVTLPMRSHSENHIIPQLVHQHKELPLSEKISTLKPHQQKELSLHEKISTLKPSHSTTTSYKGTTSPQRFHMESYSIPQHVHNHFTPQLPPSKEAISPQKLHAESHLIPQPVHQHLHHPELTHFEKTTTHQPTHSTETFSKGMSQKSHGESSSTSHLQFNHLNGISTPLPELPPKETILHQISHQDHPISKAGHHHLHLDNLEKIISHLQSQSTEPSTKTTILPQTFYKDESFKMLPGSKLFNYASEVTIAHPQHLHQKSFSKQTTKFPELHLEEKSTHSTPSSLHFSTAQIKTLHHPTIDNTTWLILEAIKRLEKEKIEEIKNLQKSQLEALHKNRISDHSHITLPDSDASSKESLNKIHATNGIFPHAPKTLKHEAQGRSGTEHDIKISHIRDITKPYPISPTTYAMLQRDLEVAEKVAKPLPPLNPNDNWKYVKKLDNYYAKQKQSTTPQPKIIRPATIPTPKPRAAAVPLITPSSTMAPTTVAPRVRPSMPPRNTTKRLNQQPTSTQKPSPVNYNINSTINRNYNITVNFVPPDSAPRENNEADEGQPEDNQSITENEPDPFTALAQPTEVSKKSNEDSAGDFDSPPHPSLPRQSLPDLSNSSNFLSLNETMQQLKNSTTSNVIPNNEPNSFVQTKITPSDDSFPISHTFGNKDAILQSPTASVTKSPDPSTTATTPYQKIIKNLKSLTLKVQSKPFFENAYFSTTKLPTTVSDTSNIPLQTPTICSNGNNTQQKCNNIIIISNKTDELMEILRLLSMINTDNNEPPSTDFSSAPILQSPRSSQAAFPRPQSNPFTEIKSLLKSIHKTQMTPSEVIELRKSISDLLKILKQRRSNELSRLHLSKLDPMVGDGRDCVQAITQINEYVELLELMMVYLARDPNKLLDEIKDARFDNFESPYPQDDPQRRLIEDQFYFVNPKILNEFIDVYKKYSKNEPYFGKPTWQFSQENGARKASNSRSRSFGGTLNNLFHFDELIPALAHNRAPMYRPGIQYEGY